ncbi:MAG: phosphate acyltransferase PlsX [Candidatus Marinimicrobia bacterium]|jgi:glycerol-3-phosphate acyltransferase PlsX|nr:phosphate--acyl-ACP acyltransferase [Candidatus Neomarinimicrobiota bacterium]MDP6500591.1 phosphate acyltransferase PlsX [Candidatus Neomarinimicrobiota bacterium]MDP6726136.1 phosphate acyltransferase PlsX [Candidatus Neomarinimicrobiota bacterium]|tara:strand:+ start:58496 stop:59500 length:1005 start_codon:yes stop_codon:yes gene_type:complete
MKIALDAMGGDFAPEAAVHGALDALNIDNALELYLVGNEDLIKNFLPSPQPNHIHLIPTTQVVTMHDRGSRVLKEKPDSSLVKGVELLKDGIVDAFVSAGHTGAVLSSAILTLGRIEGAKRPALGAYIPTDKGGKILCDVGANPDAKPNHLMQFAIMASLYLDHVEKIKNPKIGLINIGTEPGKGSELYRQAYDLLKQEFPSFIGNVESRNILTSEADVLICDGFVGNTLIKFAEGWISLFSDMVKNKIDEKLTYKMGAKILYPVLKSINSQYDYEEHGGSPLLGVNGVCIIAHGSSNAKAIKNSISLAKKCVDEKLITDIQIGLTDHLENNSH